MGKTKIIFARDFSGSHFILNCWMDQRTIWLPGTLVYSLFVFVFTLMHGSASAGKGFKPGLATII